MPSPIRAVPACLAAAILLAAWGRPAVAADAPAGPLKVHPGLVGSPVVPAGTPRAVTPAEFARAMEDSPVPASSLRPSIGLGAETRSRPKGLPTFIRAEFIGGRNDVEVIAEGQVELRKLGTLLEADRLTYWQERDEMEAAGRVRLEREGDTMAGPKMRLRLDDSTGYFEQPVYTIIRNKTGRPASGPPTVGHGKADRLLFEGEDHYRLQNATYSTCGPDRDPDWFVRVSDLKLDYERETGTGTNATVVFRGAPILYAPYMSFSLNNKRKSGLLTPTFGSTSKSGIEFTQPVYWDIAPNMDATIAPRFMSKRGTQWNTEYRYLTRSASGHLRYELLPEDRIIHDRRAGYSLSHNQDFGGGLTGTLNLNGVSDDTYFTDLSTRLSAVSQTNLLRQGTLGYGGSWWNAAMIATSYQTLQDPSLPAVVAPYRRLPQFNVNAARADLPFGLAFALAGEHVSFRHDTLIDGQRVSIYPQVSLPFQAAGAKVTPKLGWHVTRYNLDRAPAAGANAIQFREVPIGSVDAQLTFERPLAWFDGNSYTQTLEPRAYYLYVPRRDQGNLPVFDTGVADFNFAQIFGENRYAGNDRIGDADQLTGMLTSRLLDPASGQELLRAAIGQRFYFTTQHVTLPGETPRADTRTDLLGTFSGRILPRMFVDTALQYNPHTSQADRFSLSGRYQPEPGKVLNLSYRYNRDQFVPNQPGVIQTTGLEHLDVSGQWPLFGGWHAAGRFNYSVKEARVIESIGGLEYDGGCWVARVVGQRLATQTQQSTTAVFFQLELNGFSKIGSNPLEILKRNIPGYGIINQPVADPVFAAQ